MKYIRTSSGEILDLSYYSPKVINDPLASKDLAIYLKSYGYGKIVKEADTIEKLCDYFSFDNAFEYANPSIYAYASTARLRAKNHEKLIGYIVVEKNGAKALEPVAKTNGEGEFELLRESLMS